MFINLLMFPISFVCIQLVTLFSFDTTPYSNFTSYLYSKIDNVRLNTAATAATASVPPVTSIPVCPILGPGYPAPTNITSHGSPSAQAWVRMIDTIETYLNSSQYGSMLGQTSFSIGVFSLGDAHAQRDFQYHHTAPAVKSSTVGVKKVNGDTMYRVGSISKVFTVYTALAEVGSSYWSRPVTDFVPQLAAAAAANSTDFDPINKVDWEKVTLGALAGQVSGVTRDINDILSASSADPSQIVLPLLNASNPLDISCYASSNCTEYEYLQQVIARPPTYAPWTTPVYSNAAYAVLAVALSHITGKDFMGLLQEKILDALQMTSSGEGVPSDPSKAVAFNNSFDVWKLLTGFAAPDGGYYSTVNDMARFGISILNSTLLCSLETRGWLKPITHTGDLRESIGRPWEIYRYPLTATAGRVNDLYTKGGDVPGYDAEFVLSPDHQTGLTILTSGPAGVGGVARDVLADLVANIFVEGLESAAAQQAATKLAGTYRLADAAADDSDSDSRYINTSISLKVDPASGPGLIVDSWVNEGVDTLVLLAQILGKASSSDLEVRLYPTDLEAQKAPDAAAATAPSTSSSSSSNSSAAVAERLAFRAAMSYSPAISTGPFSSACISWALIDALQYGNVSLDSFVISLDADGNGLSVDSRGFRALMKKADS